MDMTESPNAAHDTAEREIAPPNATLGGRKQGIVIFKNMKVVDCKKLARLMFVITTEDAGDTERGRGDGLSGLGRRSPRCAFRDTRLSDHNYLTLWDSSSFYFSS
ncbi:hypothetical protein GGP72_002668 [Salinibacter ruber]|uniref:Uncharacterized protein n=1 Tax=Salinibacter ruber TaxID=146919 RepID=A0A9X2Q1U8_9BACT|nr:hypothetical protein [Salinibacter ruber]MCS3682014.1 hypothetical protein [Salinibacter ruber]